MPKIILSYRRSDARAMAGRIRDKLASRYGERSVYMDVDNIPFGTDFRKHFNAALDEGDIVVAIIGPKWLGSAEGTTPRIFEETDPVRVEIETALRRNIAIVPILIDRTTMPAPGELPDSIRDLSFLNAAEVDDGRDFHQHMERVIRSMNSVLKGGKRVSRLGASLRGHIRGLAVVGLAAFLAAAAFVYAPQLRQQFEKISWSGDGRKASPAADQKVPGRAEPAASPPAAVAASGRRVALVIGNANYRNVTKLPTVGNDAAAMTQAFKAAGFDLVQSKVDVSNVEFKRALRDFELAANAADITVVYYAGHGMEVNGVNYLVPIDAVLARDVDAYDEAVALDRVMRIVESAARFRVVILDAGRDNPFSASVKKRTQAMPAGPFEVSTAPFNVSLTPAAANAALSGVKTPARLESVDPATPNSLIAFSAKAGSSSTDGTGPNSPFTAALLKHLFVPGLDVRLAFGRVRDDVLRATNNRQEPFVYGSLGGSVLALVPEKN